MSSEDLELQLQNSFRKRIRHPPCVSYLLRHGVPSEMGCDKASALLVRYVVMKGLNDVQGKKMARTMIKRESASRSIRGSDVQKFAECLSRARNSPKANYWSCEYIWSSKELRERGACTGWSCEYYHVGRLGQSNRQSSEAGAKMEEEPISYVLNNPESIAEALRLGPRSEGFFDEYQCRDGTRLPLNRVLWHACRYLVYHDRPVRSSAILGLLSRSPEIRPHLEEIERYVECLRSRSSCGHNRFVEHLKVIEERGARLRAQDLIHQAGIALASNALPFEIVMRTLTHQSDALSITACHNNHLFEHDIDDFMTTLSSKRCGLIPTPSAWLSASLGGGWKPGKLYAVNASCAAEATDFSAWCAEFAAQRRFITLWVSCGMSKDNLAERAVARHCGIDAKELSQYRENAFDAQADAMILERIVEAGERLSRRLGRYLVVVEGDPEMTVADLKRTVCTARDLVGASNDWPALLVLDQVLVPWSDSAKRADSVQGSAPFDEDSLLARAKLQMQDLAVAIIAVFSGNVTVGEEAFEEDEPAAELSPDHLGGLTAADYMLMLQSKHAKVRGITSEKNADQLILAREWYKRHLPQSREHVDRVFDEATGEYPLDESTCSYTRISLFEKGRRASANPVIIYERPYHRFRTMNMEPSGLEEQDTMTFDDD